MDVYPALTYRDLEAAVAFLERTFGLTMEDPVTDGRGALRAVAARHGEGRVLLQPDLPDELHGSHVGQGWVYVAVTDLDAHFQRARAAGAEVLGDPHDALDGAQRGYSARDLEGNLWSFGIDRPGGMVQGTAAS
ncbi:MAG: VOC family protein [Actinomycetota bacterium]|nr:VOC family protein [Actinomycetota bacterium]